MGERRRKEKKRRANSQRRHEELEVFVLTPLSEEMSQKKVVVAPSRDDGG